jgi:hypothetical protein
MAFEIEAISTCNLEADPVGGRVSLGMDPGRRLR